MNLFNEEQFEDGDEAKLTALQQKKQTASGEEGQLTIDVYQTDNDVVIRSTIAGVSSENLDIAVTNDMVTIKGMRHPDEKVHTAAYYYQELYWGPFSRTVILPEDVDADAAKASLKNGILTLRLPKLAKTKIKRVKIS